MPVHKTRRILSLKYTKGLLLPHQPYIPPYTSGPQLEDYTCRARLEDIYLNSCVGGGLTCHATVKIYHRADPSKVFARNATPSSFCRWKKISEKTPELHNIWQWVHIFDRVKYPTVAVILCSILRIISSCCLPYADAYICLKLLL